MDIPVYTLQELATLEPWPAVISFILLLPAFGVVWRFFFSMWAGGFPREGGFLDCWLLSARLLLFWLMFGHAFLYVLDSYAYAPDPGGLDCLRILDMEKDRSIIEPCAEKLVLRETPDGPQPTWYGAVSLQLCASEAQGKRLLGPLPQDEKSRLEEWLEDASEFLSR